MPPNTDIPTDRRRVETREHHGPPLRSTSGTRSEHLQWAAFLSIRALSGLLALPLVALIKDSLSATRRAYRQSRDMHNRDPESRPAALVVRFLEGRFAERQSDMRYGASFHARWIGCTARGHLSHRDNMRWTPHPLPGDPEVHPFELNHAGDASTIHLRNVWRSALIVKSRYGTAWFALRLSKKQLVFRLLLVMAITAALFAFVLR